MIGYIDSSVVIRLLTADGPDLVEWRELEQMVASDLLLVEVNRTLHRLEVEGRLREEQARVAQSSFDQLRASFHFLSVSSGILLAAGGPMPTVLRTLDALHIATALVARWWFDSEDFLFVTHDSRQGTAARLMGFDVVGV